MNCKCVIDCSQKSAKITYTFSSRFIHHVSTRSWIIQDICMQCHVNDFPRNLKTIQKNWKIVQKMPFFCWMYSYVYMCQWKLVYLNFNKFSKNSLPSMAYHVWRDMTFNLFWPTNDGEKLNHITISNHLLVIAKSFNQNVYIGST